MAHAEGWIEAYSLLEVGHPIPKNLLSTILSNLSSLGETMLHWYAIEGDPDILEKIIALGFNLNTVNNFGQTPLFEAALIGRWNNVKVLLAHGADDTIRNKYDESIWEYLEYEPDALKRLKELVSKK